MNLFTIRFSDMKETKLPDRCTFRPLHVNRTVWALALCLISCSSDTNSMNRSYSSELDIVQVGKVMSTAVTDVKKYLESHGDQLDVETFRKKYLLMLKELDAVAPSPIREFLGEVHVMTSEMQWYSYRFFTESKRFGKLVPINVASIKSKDQLEAINTQARTFLGTLDDYQKSWASTRNKARELRNRDGIDQKVKKVFLSAPHFAEDAKDPHRDTMYTVLYNLAELTDKQSQLLIRHWGKWKWIADDQELRMDDKRAEKSHNEIVLRLLDVKKQIDAIDKVK